MHENPRERAAAANLTLPRAAGQWEEFYRSHLVDFIMPFWRKHGIDAEHGGLLTCLADDGSVQSTDKYLWSQTRGLWTFSALYRRIERRPEWLETAHSLFGFCRRFGVGDDGSWRFRVARDGTPIDGPLSLVTDCFAIMGLAEYFRVTGNPEALALAKRTFHSVEARLNSGRPFGTAPYPVPPGLKAHRFSMQCSLAYHELWQVLPEDEILEARRRHTRLILEQYVRPEHRALVEYVNLDGSFSDTPGGRTVVPGHGIESIWFHLQIARETNDRQDLARLLTVLEWSLGWGWEPEYGGLRLALDLFGQEPVYWKFPTTKPWWPASEAMAATLLAYEIEPQPKWLEQHRKVADWALRHFPVPEHGEWRQRLDHQGRPMNEFIALPVKDPFHLPRGLIVSIEALARLRASAPQTLA